MTEKEKNYDVIRQQYPESISKSQFYRIAHISKATALHLLQNGLVPCKDTGKKLVGIRFVLTMLFFI